MYVYVCSEIKIRENCTCTNFVHLTAKYSTKSKRQLWHTSMQLWCYSKFKTGSRQDEIKFSSHRISTLDKTAKQLNMFSFNIFCHRQSWLVANSVHTADTSKTVLFCRRYEPGLHSLSALHLITSTVYEVLGHRLNIINSLWHDWTLPEISQRGQKVHTSCDFRLMSPSCRRHFKLQQFT